MRLEQYVVDRAAHTPDALAVWGPDARLTYRELDALAARLASDLTRLGVRPGHRVALWLPKSAFAVAVTQAVLRLRASYVPLDPLAPTARVAEVIADCAPAVLATSADRLPTAVTTTSGPPVDWDALPVVLAGQDPAGYGLRQPSPTMDGPCRAAVSDVDIAYVLYTSGSTGRPKGVCVGHAAATAFVEWAADELGVTAEDRLANHAPLQFDLSVFDLYAAFRSGASAHLIPEMTTARSLVRFVAEHRISVWYSVPSALTLMIEYGRLLDLDETPLRVVVFAGEVFPIDYLRELRRRWPSLTLYNFYGPTETNVCAYHRVGAIAADRATPVPIGRAACGDDIWAVHADGTTADVGEEGELFVAGPTLMSGYLGEATPFTGPYATGDIVRRITDDEFEYIGRRDHMVKVRGHRIELGEIESVLHTHPDIIEAVVAVVGTGHHARLRAWITTRRTGTLQPIDVKRFLSRRLPRHMVIDSVRSIAQMPRTSNGKVDKQRLLADSSG